MLQRAQYGKWKERSNIQPRNLTNIPQPGDPGGKSTATSHVDSMGLQYDETDMLMGSTVSPKNSYVEVLTPSTSECECIWREDLLGDD